MVFLVEVGLILARKLATKVDVSTLVPIVKSNLFDVIIVSLVLKRFLTDFVK